ncbi:MAG: arylsulfatase [Prolixibacteraceae bacterium]|nr:arylsulfatase [Prolixibacteraceae bacterium]
MKRNSTIFTFILIMFIQSCGIQGEEKDEKRLNILLIVTDDLGYSDLGFYGSKIETPNINSLAENGIAFSQFYNGARCCPSRASLLTGLYAHQAGIGHMTEDRGLPAYSGDLSKNAVTIAEVLKAAGYYTAMTGKWHVTKNTKPESPKDNWPLQRGFDRFYGTLPGHGSLYDPAGLVDGNKMIKADGDFYYTEKITSKSQEFICEAVQQEKPFFMYIAYTAPHYPLQARPEVIQKYKGKFSEGWDEIRTKRYNKLVEKGLIKPEWKLPERDEQSIPWEDEPEKAFQENRMEVFAAMIDHVDQGVGEIIKTLKETGQFENTIIIFLSDNGGSAEGHRDGKIERWGTPWKSSVIPVSTRDGRKVIAGDFPGLPLGGPETYGSYGVRWANVSNAPFRLHKSWLHEGGISTPFIMHYPAGLKQRGITHQVGHIIDLMPTIINLAGAEYPESFNGNKIPQLEGTDLIELLNKKEIQPRTICWEHEGNRAIRKGKWKLVSEFPGTWSTVRAYKNKGRWELYDMEKDRTEQNDLATQFPEKVKELESLWNNWAKRVGVVLWSELVNDNY